MASTKPLSAAKINQVKELLSEGKLTRDQVAAITGVGQGTVSKIKHAMNAVSGEHVERPNEELSQTEEIKGDTWTISIPKTRICTEAQLVEHCKIDLTVWEIDKIVFNKWDMGYKDADGNADALELFQVKAFCKRKKHIVDARAEIEALKAEAKQAMFVPKPVIYTTQNSDNMFEALIPDLHAAKLAWGRETGYKNYDTGEAVDCYRRAIDELLMRASSFNLGKIILGVGNDLLQADNIQGTTYAGTKVDVDSRYRKTYVTVRKMLAETIEKLRQVAPIEVKVVPGNHDTLSSFTLGDSLECKFEHYPDVIVDNGPMMHKTVEWGDVFLVLTHGDKGKQADYGAWLATTYRKEFGRTRFNEIHVGHKHKLAVDEKYGIRVRTFSSLSGTDEWHASNLFTGNLRVADGLIWNKTKGLIAQFHHTEIDSPNSKSEAA